MSDNDLICQTRNRPYMIAESAKGHMILFQPRCKLWSCPACAALNMQAWQFKTRDSALQLEEKGEHMFFLTITSHERNSMAKSLYVWPLAWKKLRSRMRYHAGRPVPYLMIPEQHKDGRLHVHLIETSGLGERWWKDHPRECGLGYMNEEDEINSVEGAVGYVTKYLGKALGSYVIPWPKGFRRIRTSQSWPKPRPSELQHEYDFRMMEKGEMLQDIIERAYIDGKRVTLCDHKTAWKHVIESVTQVDNDQ